jgi:hypothetical protein
MEQTAVSGPLGSQTYKTGQRGYDSAAFKIAKAQHWMANKLVHVADPAYPSPPDLQFLKSAAECSRDEYASRVGPFLPRYFRLLFDEEFGFSGSREVLENKLVLNRKSFKAEEDEDSSVQKLMVIFPGM